MAEIAKIRTLNEELEILKSYGIKYKLKINEDYSHLT